MTQKQKAEAYDKAFEIAKNIHRFSSNIAEIKRMEEIFPELVESEDEKIRKELITHCRNTKCVTEEGAEMIAKWIDWLEKQSTDISSFPKEQQVFMRKYVSLDKITLIKLLAERDANNTEIIESFEKQGEQKYKFRIGDTIKEKSTGDIVTICEIDLKNREYRLTNTGFIPFKYEYLWELAEQKPVDKIEPKFNFKVGQWIVATGKCVYLIAKIDGFNVTLVDTDGDEYAFDASSLDDAHEWTIQDAKDGDVLCTYECEEPKIVFLLKGTPKKHYALSYYCYYNIMYPHFDDGNKPGCLAPEDSDVKPATKEQRDLLFQKMKENGYEWDAEKKELKKIDKENLTEFEIAVKNVMEEAIEAGDTHNLKADAENLLRITRPTWSEEDEGRLKSCLNILQPKTSTGKNVETINTKWLKSLKERLL